MKQGQSRIKREFCGMFGCLVIALLLNAFAINKYQTQWSELYTTWRITLVLTLVIYAFVWIVRLLLLILKRLLWR